MVFFLLYIARVFDMTCLCDLSGGERKVRNIHSVVSTKRVVLNVATKFFFSTNIL